MNKLAPILLLISLPLVGLFISSASPANTTTTPGINSLKQNLIKSFIQQANNPKSKLHHFIQKVNQDHTDGRNQLGVLPKTITANNIQVLPVSGENQFGSYCTNTDKPEQSKCESKISETYLITIVYKMGVHKATEYNSLNFLAEVAKKVEWKQDANGKQYDRKEFINTNQPAPANLVKTGN